MRRAPARDCARSSKQSSPVANSRYRLSFVAVQPRDSRLRRCILHRKCMNCLHWCSLRPTAEQSSSKARKVRPNAQRYGRIREEIITMNMTTKALVGIAATAVLSAGAVTATAQPTAGAPSARHAPTASPVALVFVKNAKDPSNSVLQVWNGKTHSPATAPGRAWEPRPTTGRRRARAIGTSARRTSAGSPTARTDRLRSRPAGTARSRGTPSACPPRSATRTRPSATRCSSTAR